MKRRLFHALDANALSLAVSPDRTLAAIALESFPEQRNTRLEIIDLTTTKTRFSHEFSIGDSGAAHRSFSRDNRFYIHFINQRVFVFDLHRNTLHAEFDIPADGKWASVKSASFSINGETCVLSDSSGMLHQFSVPDFEFMRTERGDDRLVIRGIHSPDGKTFGAVGFNRRVNLFDAATLKPIPPADRFTRTSKYLNDMQFSPDGRRIATGSPDGTIRLWDVESGEELLKFQTRSAYYPGLAFSPDGMKLLVASGDEAFVAHAADEKKMNSLSVTELKDIACQTRVSPWREFEEEGSND